MPPASAGLAPGSRATLRIKVRSAQLDLPVVVEAPAPGTMAIVPAELPGIVRTAADRPVSFSAGRGIPVMEKPGYRGFRLYARHIDDVAGIYRIFAERDIDVDAKLAAIERVQALDRGLTRLFWLVATVGILGGIACLAASLYGAVQRKRRDFGMLRLLGFTRLELLGFPLVQAVVIAVAAFVLAAIAFAGSAWFINAVFARDLPLGQHLCKLPAGYLAAACALTVALCAASAIHAARAAAQIEPAEAIRVE
jgi:putative ABC transport system permease protein